MNTSIINVNGNPAIGKRLSPYIIAEVGTNHNGDRGTALEMIKELSKTGCDCIKFQIYEAEEIVSKKVRAKEYGLDKFYGDILAYEMFDKILKTPKAWFPEMSDLCHELGMDCAVTIHGEIGRQWVIDQNIDLIKIASMDHTNIPFLQSLVNTVNLPILASLGMARLEDVYRLVDTMRGHEPGFGVFHCSAVYPPGKDDVRLSNIRFLSGLRVNVGFSDHTLGFEDALGARKIGARMFEKHITLDKNQEGPDHPFAMEVPEFKEYVRKIKEAECTSVLEAASSEDLQYINPTENEMKNREKYVKSIVASTDLDVGDIITEENVYLARPGTGIEPIGLNDILGERLKYKVEAETPLKWTDIEGD